MPVIRVQVVAGENGAPNRLAYGIREVDDSAVAAQVAALQAGGEIEVECAFREGALRVERIVSAAAVPLAPIHADAKAHLDAGDPQAALATLERHRAAVETHPTLLGHRVRARIATGDPGAAASDVRAMLAIERRPPNSDGVPWPDFPLFFFDLPRSVAVLVAEDFGRFCIATRPYDPLRRFDTIGIENWSTEFLVMAAQAHLAAPNGETHAIACLEELARREPGHLQLSALRARLSAVQATRLRAAGEQAAAQAQRPADAIGWEMFFRANLSSALRARWNAWNGPFLPPSEWNIGAIAKEAEAIAAAVFSAEERARVSTPVVPFARDTDGRLLALYLLDPRPDGDYAVLRVGADRSLEVIALSSAEWLASLPR